MRALGFGQDDAGAKGSAVGRRVGHATVDGLGGLDADLLERRLLFPGARSGAAGARTPEGRKPLGGGIGTEVLLAFLYKIGNTHHRSTSPW